mmetsp:Transcript_111617/g.216137  ORF Transcript_111617/g.216137 Transcript_111617/m.216137 type:complete len:186 (-) Transcript_111617:38-595(-)|eukprot:CAMPEP_0172717352 /NCGR_PEP_ID=MMETSP1074-20121228/71187_1 /TAXON_ID=2916 /ORGANISM="Ceratium fusus, Strain PA161109" /LENGTH=185 /DNA_ID=CAMNT_0013542275 /DNA_START=72 /DNA_END=629 /DNA_ORIENTATION=+
MARRRLLATRAIFGSATLFGVKSALSFVPAPLMRLPSAETAALTVRQVSPQQVGESATIDKTSHETMLFVTAVLVGLGAGMQSASAEDATSVSTDCMPSMVVADVEEERGYIQNAVSYVQLSANFMLGFFGSLFGGIQRALAKPGPFKYILIAAIVAVLSFLVWTVLAMTGNVDVPGMGEYEQIN